MNKNNIPLKDKPIEELKILMEERLYGEGLSGSFLRFCMNLLYKADHTVLEDLVLIMTENTYKQVMRDLYNGEEVETLVNDYGEIAIEVVDDDPDAPYMDGFLLFQRFVEEVGDTKQFETCGIIWVEQYTNGVVH